MPEKQMQILHCVQDDTFGVADSVSLCDCGRLVVDPEVNRDLDHGWGSIGGLRPERLSQGLSS
jgi:hypothetical protein